jgi:hypothetical protein
MSCAPVAVRPPTPTASAPGALPGVAPGGAAPRRRLLAWCAPPCLPGLLIPRPPRRRGARQAPSGCVDPVSAGRMGARPPAARPRRPGRSPFFLHVKTPADIHMLPVSTSHNPPRQPRAGTLWGGKRLRKQSTGS